MKTTIEIAYHDNYGPVYVMGIPDEVMKRLDLHADDEVEVTFTRDDVGITVNIKKLAAGQEGGE